MKMTPDKPTNGLAAGLAYDFDGDTLGDTGIPATFNTKPAGEPIMQPWEVILDGPGMYIQEEKTNEN